MSLVAPDSSILRSQGASEREKVSSRALFLASSRFETLLRRFFFYFRPRQSASRSSRLERERCSTFLLSALDRTKNASQNGSKTLPKCSRNLIKLKRKAVFGDAYSIALYSYSSVGQVISSSSSISFLIIHMPSRCIITHLREKLSLLVLLSCF